MLGMLWVVGAPARLFVVALIVVGVVALYLAATSPERLEPAHHVRRPVQGLPGRRLAAGHGLFGMSSGGIFGKGIGASQQKWGNLPEAHTDFIFAVLGEELGLVGTLLVLAAVPRPSRTPASGSRAQHRDPFVRYVTAGITIWLIGQMMINVGMVLALLPVIGIPLPLVSYGGSALVPVAGRARPAVRLRAGASPAAAAPSRSAAGPRRAAAGASAGRVGAAGARRRG